MQISYNEATGRDCSSLEQDLILCEKNGFDFIEIRLHMLRDYLKTHSVDELAAFFAGSHLKPHAFNALYIFDQMFTPDTDPAREAQVMEDFMLGCTVGKKIGAHYFIVVPDIYDDDANNKVYVDTEENIFNDSVRILKKLSKIAKEYDMNLCWEPVGSVGCAVKTVEQAWKIVQAVDEPNVGLTLDSFNLFLYGKLNEFSVFQTLDKDKIFAVHINNADDQPLGILDHCHRRFCDSGEIDLKDFLGNLKKVGYEGMVSIETFRPEYWAREPEWVIAEAYRTTRDAVAQISAE